MKRRNNSTETGKEREHIALGLQETLQEALEMSLEKTLEGVVTCLYQRNNAKSRLYEELIDMTDRALLKIALKRSNDVKTAAADFLGINRNTLQKKLVKLGME